MAIKISCFLFLVFATPFMDYAWQHRNGSGGTLSGVAPLFSFFSSKTEVIPEGGITFFLFRARSSKELYVTKGTNYIVQ